VLALGTAAFASWSESDGARGAAAAQPQPDPTPAPVGSDPAASPSATPTTLPSTIPTVGAPPTPPEHRVPLDPRRWPVVPRIDADTKTRLRAVLQAGQALGNRTGVFAKAGDSITATNSFLTDVGCGAVNLAGHIDVVRAMAAFSQDTVPTNGDPVWCGASNSFTRTSLAAERGWSAGNALAPFAEPVPDPACASAPYDAPLPCELHLLHPSVAVVMFGTNDAEHSADPARFVRELTAIVTACVDTGVIPILSTIPPRPGNPEMDGRVLAYNQAIVRIAFTQRVPLVNYWRALVDGDTINQGIGGDGVHPTVASGCTPHCEATDFSDEGLRYGFDVRNLTTLQALTKVLNVVIDDGPPDSGTPAGGPS
jgi:hypothetical protein